MLKLIVLSAVLLLLHVTPAHAYIGPGAGAGAIIVVLGIVASIFLAFVAVLWYPFKRFFKNRKKKKLEKEKNKKESESKSYPDSA